MSKYDFICPNCGVIEVDHPMSEDHPTHCPYCEAEFEGQILTAPPIFFEGRGIGGEYWKKRRPKEVNKYEQTEVTSDEAGVPYE